MHYHISLSVIHDACAKIESWKQKGEKIMLATKKKKAIHFSKKASAVGKAMGVLFITKWNVLLRADVYPNTEIQACCPYSEKHFLAFSPKTGMLNDLSEFRK